MGIDGEAITSCARGHLRDFFDVPVNTRAAKNILSLREVEKLYRVTYVQGVEFVVHARERRYHFRVDDENHYSCDFSNPYDSEDSDGPPALVSDDSSDDEDDNSEYSGSESSADDGPPPLISDDEDSDDDDFTVRTARAPSDGAATSVPADDFTVRTPLGGTKSVLAYSKREIAEATAAGELLNNSSHMTERELCELVESGGAFDKCPITKEHIKRLFDITGGDIAAIRGRTTREKQQSSDVRASQMERETQSFYSDVLFIRNQPYLVSTVVPLDLTLVSDLPNQSEKSFLEAISGQFEAIRSRRFYISALHVDPQLGLAKLKRQAGRCSCRSVRCG